MSSQAQLTRYLIDGCAAAKTKARRGDYDSSAKKILGLLQGSVNNGGVVYTKELTKVSCNHTARIADLRRGKIDGKNHLIRSVYIGGEFGFVYEGVY